MSSISASPKLLNRFYEVLVLLRVLDQVQGPRIEKQLLQRENVNNVDIVELRREVLYQLCIMADFQKGGYTVTAMAMQDIPSGPRYWLSANGCLEKIRKFLLEVLQCLCLGDSELQKDGEGSALAVLEGQLLEMFTIFQRPRSKSYWKLLQPCLKRELERIDLSPQPHTGSEYGRWLQSFRFPLSQTADLLQLSQMSFESRHSVFLRVQFDPVTAQSAVMENQSRAAIRHYIGRLSAPRRAAKFLAYVGINHPSMFQGFSLHGQSCGAAWKPPHLRAKLTLAGIHGRMYSETSPESEALLKSLQSLDKTGSIMDRILDQYEDKHWHPNAHAELVLLEALYDADCSFYSDDKFIACSKAACFCCYHYICSHPGLFTRPACHNKVHLNWRPPDLHLSRSDFRHIQQRDILIKLTQEVRRAVVEKITQRGRRMAWHPDSSTGITPSETLDFEARLQSVHRPEVVVASDPESASAGGSSSLVLCISDDDEEGGIVLPPN